MTDVELFFHCDSATGAIISMGLAAAGNGSQQPAPAGQTLVVVPADAVTDWSSPTPDFSILRSRLCARVDVEAEDWRGRFITGGAGQALTYLRKEAQARAYVADNAAVVPLLAAEAAATGTTVAALAAEVIATADQWATVGDAIEAARRGAKHAIMQATDILAITTAAIVDWEAVTNGN